MEIFKQQKYFDNLTVKGTDVISYVTKVAEIDHGNKQVIKLEWETSNGRSSSPTTSKHINYVASELDYEVVDIYDIEMDLKS